MDDARIRCAWIRMRALRANKKSKSSRRADRQFSSLAICNLRLIKKKKGNGFKQ